MSEQKPQSEQHIDLPHLNERGEARMVDVAGKPVTRRRAAARGAVYVRESTLEAIAQNEVPKGDVFAVARVAGITAAKRCDELIPLCHSLPLDFITIDLRIRTDPARVEISAETACTARTGAEMEALTAVSVAALTVYDMIKAVDRTAIIGDIRLVSKSGGKSGRFVREEE